jgi:hypothetical protein
MTSGSLPSGEAADVFDDVCELRAASPSHYIVKER